ncbi:MAG: GSCFA domain-containing protein [Bacteroidales bacterium]
MEFRTTFEIKQPGSTITYKTPVLFLGSCFASEIGKIMLEGKMNVLINPPGTLFNPSSISAHLRDLLNNTVYKTSDLILHDGHYLSLNHYTSFTSDDSEDLLARINSTTVRARSFLQNASFLFITFGTARAYRYNDTGSIVSNCHRIPASKFSNELLDVEAIVSDWKDLLEKLALQYPSLDVIFTVSPVRHLRDGVHANQVSKSILFLAIEKLLELFPRSRYFPAYELLMDDLRDYRFYGDDLVHPSDKAVEYIWDAFSSAYLDKQTLNLWKEVRKVKLATRHRPIGGSVSAVKSFASSMLKTIDDLGSRNPGIDLGEERSVFESMI